MNTNEVFVKILDNIKNDAIETQDRLIDLPCLLVTAAAHEHATQTITACDILKAYTEHLNNLGLQVGD